jgi:hypothetical protein
MCYGNLNIETTAWLDQNSGIIVTPDLSPCEDRELGSVLAVNRLLEPPLSPRAWLSESLSAAMARKNLVESF